VAWHCYLTLLSGTAIWHCYLVLWSDTFTRRGVDTYFPPLPPRPYLPGRSSPAFPPRPILPGRGGHGPTLAPAVRAASERPLIIPVQWLHQQKRTQDGEKAVDPSGYHWNDMTEGNRWEDIDNELIAEIDGWLQTAPLRRYCTSYIYVRNDLL
jgi:hypothetical protein